MNAEITDNTAKPTRGWVFYDGDCAFCVRGLHRWGRVFARRGFAWVPLQAPGSAARVGVSEQALLTEMHLLLPAGSVRSGIAAWALMFQTVWWLSPLGALLALPGFRELGRVLYRRVASNRYCFGGACKNLGAGRCHAGLIASQPKHGNQRHHHAATTFWDMP